MNREQLEAAAIDAHGRGLSWATFWPTVAGDVAALELDYFTRGELVHRLVGLLASGDAEGHRAVGDGEPWPADDDYAAVVPTISDTETSARCLWSPMAENSGVS